MLPDEGVIITSTESGSARSDATMEKYCTGAKPGEQGRWSLCPDGAGQQTVQPRHFINTPIELSGGYW